MMKKIKNKLKKILKKIKNLIGIRIPTPYPIYEGTILKDKVALITGGSSGIGYSIAENFINNKASVIITGRNTEKLKKAVQKLENKISKGQFVKYYNLDISDIENIKENLNHILNDISVKIDILVNNAGISSGEAIGNTKLVDFENVIRTNLEGTYFISQEIFNYMRNNNIRGNILNVASSSSLRPATNAYSLSKWSILGFTKGLAKKAIEYDIVVNGIAPGPTATPMLVDDVKNITLKNSPAGRYTMPEEIANICTILVSNMGRMIIGDTVFITGGSGIITYDDIKY